ncbi:hypothetical protein TNCV_739511 [Trichonephila clavipes]|nr:hypothetical protein TNCV_739511 [Trichonephila clavipes]
MDDNARPHQTLAVEELLESEDITRMVWPAYSPDLNPIEHVRMSSREAGGKEREVGTPDHPQGVLPQNWGGTEPNRTVTYIVLKAKGNDWHKNLALSLDEFRGP